MKNLLTFVLISLSLPAISQELNDFNFVSLLQDGTEVNTVNMTEGGCYEITAENGGDLNLYRSAIWNNNTIDLTQAFEFTFDITFDNPAGDAADGIAFVLQAEGIGAIGEPGRGIGYDGINNSLAVELDLYHNGDFPTFEENYDHLSVTEGGDHSTPIYTTSEPSGCIRFDKDNIADGQCRQLIIRWDPTSNLFTVEFDGVVMVSMNRDIINQSFGGSTNVWWGFTGSIGGESATARVCIPEAWTTDDDICEGEATQLRAMGALLDTDFNWTPDATLTNPNSGTTTATPTSTTTYTATFNSSCSARPISLDVNINVRPLPTSDLEDVTICDQAGSGNITSADLNAGSDGDSYTWTDPSGGNHSGQILTNQTQPGTYQVEIVKDGCRDNFTAELTAETTPVFDLGPDIQDCEDGFSQAVTVGVAADTYEWTRNSTVVSNDQTYTITSAGTYEVIAERNGCQYTDQIVATLAPDLEVNLTGNDFCEGTIATLTADFTDADSYSWQRDSEAPISNNSNTLTVSAGGTYKVTVYKDGCDGEDVFVINEKPRPDPTIDGDNQMCDSESGKTLTVNESNNLTGLTYLWTVGMENTQSITVNQTGNYEVVVTKDGCSDIAYFPFTVIETPQFTVDGDLDECEGRMSNQMDAVITNTYDQIEWKDDQGNVLGNGANHTFTAGGLYELVVSNQGCEDSKPFTMVEIPFPVINDFANLSGCEGEINIQLNASITGVADAYRWEDNTGNSLSTNNSYLFTSAGDYKLFVSNQDCETQKDFTISEIIKPIVVPNGDDEKCANDPASILTANVTNGLTNIDFLWSRDGNDVGNTSSISMDQSGTYTVVASNQGCTNTASHSFTVHPHPDFQVDGIFEGCENAINSDLSLILDPNSQADSYEWFDDNNNLISSNITHTFNQAGNYVARATYNGCPTNIPFEIEEIPLPQFTIDGAIDRCDNEATESLKPIITNGVTGVSYEWTLDGQPYGTASEVQAGQAGTYQLTISNQGCEHSESHLFNVIAAPVFDFTDPGSICPDGPAITLDANYNSTSATYEWQTITQTTTTPSLNITEDDAGSITLRITDNGCTDELTKPFVKEVVTDFYFQGIFDKICSDESDLIDLTYFDGPIEWEDGSNEKIVPYLPGNGDATTLLVKAVHPNCPTEFDEHTIQHINCRCPYFIPNAFAPTSEIAENTQFKPIISGDCNPSGYEFSIYNRWGQLIFQSTDLTEGWDGRINGEFAQSNVFVWKLSFFYDNAETEYRAIENHGHVTIVR